MTTHGEWDLATYRQSYDELMGTAKALREERDVLAEELASFDADGESLADKVRYWHELWVAQVDAAESFKSDADQWRERARQAEALVHQLGEALAEALGTDGLNIMFTDGALATRAEWTDELEALAAFRAFGGGR